jgi:UDPglucose 6-dehydrogenase
MQINESQPQRFVGKVRDALGTLAGKRLAVLGLAFKGGTDDVRDSPAIAIAQSLLREGCTLRAFDPAAMERAHDEFSPADAITFARSAYDAALGADALLVLTDWEEFLSLDFDRLRSLLREAILFDGRNLYDPIQMQALGFVYCGVGRCESRPSQPSEASIAGEEAA